MPSGTAGLAQKSALPWIINLGVPDGRRQTAYDADLGWNLTGAEF
jgi:hypothetical protein